MSWVQEFKTFALKGSMVDLAIGVVIGAAFGKVINSLVSDIIMPPLGLLLGGMNFNSFQAVIKKAAEDRAEVAIKYGLFINTLVDFLIIAFAIFFVIKVMNRLRSKKEVAPTNKSCPECLSEIPIEAKKCKYCTSSCEIKK